MITDMLKSEKIAGLLAGKHLSFDFVLDGLDFLVPGNLKSPPPNSSTVLKYLPKYLQS